MKCTTCDQPSILTLMDRAFCGDCYQHLLEQTSYLHPEIPKVWMEYIGEELALFWESPYGHGKEKIATFWWPTHPPEKTKEVEAIFEKIAIRAEGNNDQ